MTLKLLVADDSVTIQKITGLAFSAEDAVVEAVSSGDAAMDAVRTFKPDVVLADVFMPGYSGYEICERIKNDPEMAKTPVILLVGTFEPFDESEASRVRCDAHLTKPFDTSEMIETVRSLAGDKMMPQNGETPDYSPAQNMQSSMPSHSDATRTRGRYFENPDVWDSYLSDSSVLEIFDQETRTAVRALALLKGDQSVANEYPSIPDTKIPEGGDPISEKLLGVIVDRVVRKISPDIIREVAWDVIPELSEILIRRVIEKRDQS
jgi:CheY-like chemotaxis protein